MNYVHRIFNKIKRTLNPAFSRFDLSGERVDIVFRNKIDFDLLDLYQKSHYRRYEFAHDIINENDVCGDFACGTGYGSVMLSNKAKTVIGIDINKQVIKGVRKRYPNIKNVEFIQANLLNLNFDSVFDSIVSFETIEHFSEKNIQLLLDRFAKHIKPNGTLIFSTPYMQERSEAAIKLGHHLTFYIDEYKLEKWAHHAGFKIEMVKYQSYNTHEIKDKEDNKDFIIGIARKIIS